MKELTSAYEKGLYGGDIVNHRLGRSARNVGRFNQKDFGLIFDIH